MMQTKENALRRALLDDSVQIFKSELILMVKKKSVKSCKIINFFSSFFIIDLLQKVRAHKKCMRIDDEWTKYLNCENLPNTDVPSEIRSFIYQWQHTIEEFWDKKLNWWLYCDDRSVLSQNVYQNDFRRKLINTLREPTGLFYHKNVSLMSVIYQKLMESIRRNKVHADHNDDLLKVFLML
jgi:hypothetical protein